VAGTVTTYVQPITQPLEGLHNSFTQLASQHRTINTQLRNHANDLISGSGLNFKGQGAQAFSGLVNYYLDTSEKHMKTFDDAAGAVQTCHLDITTASVNADGAGLHPGLTNHVLGQVSHDDIIQRGSEPIWAVVNDMMKTLGDMVHQGGSLVGDFFTGHWGNLGGDLGRMWGDLGNLGSDAMSLVQDIGHVLGSWADTVWNAVKTCASFIASAAWHVADFVLGISSIINDVKTLFDPHKSLWDKLLAAGDLALNVGMDVSMFFGVGEALKGGELLLKGGIDLGEKFMEDGGENVVKKEFEELTDKGAEDLAGQPRGGYTTGASPDGNPGWGLGKLEGKEFPVTEENVSKIEQHLSKDMFTVDGEIAPENAKMIERLRTALAEGKPISGADASFYFHELTEANLMDNEGLDYDVAHRMALDYYHVSDFSVYHPDVIREFGFNKNWLKFWEGR
jgi:hypothetical protein